MACVSKLANAIAYDCDTGATGLVSAIIINKADIASFTVDYRTMSVSGVTLVPGATPYKIDTVKRSLVLSSALKVNDGAPNAYSHSAKMVYSGKLDTPGRSAMSAFSNGSFVIMAKVPTIASPYVYGLYYGMSATAAEQNSHDNGAWATYTLETPENVIGEDSLAIAADEYDALYKVAVG
jgi:hypothetical protein